jgi:hypothetical protein
VLSVASSVDRSGIIALTFGFGCPIDNVDPTLSEWLFPQRRLAHSAKRLVDDMGRNI